MSLKDFQILHELGKGAFGTVHKVKRKIDGEIYALKTVPMNRLSNKEKENALNEIRILASINCPNVISYKDAFYDETRNSICMVMEYADDGDLENKISYNVKNKVHFTEKEIWDIFRQIANGLKSLHDKKIMHRDLKCANIFLTKKKEVKIGDMNVSKILKMGFVNTQTGTPYYASPEVWNEKPYDYKSDIWSLGCILYEMCAGKPPFRGSSLEQVYHKVIKGVYDVIPVLYSKDLKLLITHLLKVDPVSRPSIDALLASIGKSTGVFAESSVNTHCVGNLESLMKTIRVPNKLKELNLFLPKAKYIKESSEGSSQKTYLNLSISLKKPSSAATSNKALPIHPGNINKKRGIPISREERMMLLKNIKQSQNDSLNSNSNSNSNVVMNYIYNVVNTISCEKTATNKSKSKIMNLKNLHSMISTNKNNSLSSKSRIDNQNLNINKNISDSSNAINEYNNNLNLLKLKENEAKIQQLKEKYNIKRGNYSNTNIVSTEENSMISINSNHTRIKSAIPRANSAKKVTILNPNLNNPAPENKLPLIPVKNKIPKGRNKNDIKSNNNKIQDYYRMNPTRNIKVSVLEEKVQSLYQNLHPEVLQYANK